MPARKRVFVLLIGNKERGDVNHFQLLQEETAISEGRRLEIDVEVAFAPASTSCARSSAGSSTRRRRSTRWSPSPPAPRRWR
jgi:hypothetical protein